MIPAAVSSGLLALQAAIAANAPIASATPYQVQALVAQGTALLATIDAAIAAAGAPLDAADPIGHPLAMIADLQGRLTAVSDQSVLSDMRGYVGRAVLNLAQGVA